MLISTLTLTNLLRLGSSRSSRVCDSTSIGNDCSEVPLSQLMGKAVMLPCFVLDPRCYSWVRTVHSKSSSDFNVHAAPVRHEIVTRAQANPADMGVFGFRRVPVSTSIVAELW